MVKETPIHSDCYLRVYYMTYSRLNDIVLAIKVKPNKTLVFAFKYKFSPTPIRITAPGESNAVGTRKKIGASPQIVGPI